MLPFRKPQSDEEIPSSLPPPRWNIGIEKERVATFVGIALIAGFIFGYATARFTSRGNEEKATAQPKPAERASEKPETSPPVTGLVRVTRILRADTVEVERLGPVRLIGVETPDGKMPAETYEMHGKNALAFTENNLLNQEVRIDFDPAFAAQENKDASGRTLAYIYLSDGKLFNAELIKQGHAFVREEPFKLLEDFQGYEREAIAVMSGLWGMANASASSTASATSPTSATTTPAGAAKPGKLSPLSPSEIGPNIPAISGSTSTVPASPSEPMVYVSSPERIYHKNGCELLGKKKQLMALSQAKSSGHVACGRCFPSTSMKAR